MSVLIVLYPSENLDLVANLLDYCKRRNYSIAAENIIINSKDTLLVKYIISGRNVYKNKHKLPGYNIYTPFNLTTEKHEQSAVIALLNMFYDVNVVYAQDGDIFTYFFEDADTPLYVITANYKIYTQACLELSGYNLISTSPLMEQVLRVYPNPDIRKFRNYPLWYIDSRSDASISMNELDILKSEGFFIPPVNMYTDLAIQQFDFHTLGGQDLAKEFPDYVGKVSAKFIRGPLVLGSRLDETFFIEVLNGLNNNVIPLVDVKVSYICNRYILAGCVFAYVNNACEALVNSEDAQCLDINEKPFPCKEGQCTTVSCEMLMDISVYNDIGNDKGYIKLPIKNITSLQQIISNVEIESRTVSILAVNSITQGLNIRVALSKLDVVSVLLQDSEGYFVAVQNYDDDLEQLQEDTTLSIQQIQKEASILANYDSFGKGYEYTGIYSIPSLQGLLGSIPITIISDKSSINIHRTKQKIYEITSSDGVLLDTVSVNHSDILNDINVIYEKYIKQYGNNIIITAWEKTYLETLSGNTFSSIH